MSAGVAFPQIQPPPPILEPNPQSDEIIRQQVWGVLVGVYPQGNIVEKRQDQRFPYPHLLYLTPVGPDGLAPIDESVTVVGKTLSERGLGFFYQSPIAHRRMIASLETSEHLWAGFLIDITWCRFTRYGWYESGGRFIQSVPSPIKRTVR
jgi:hypothetical protein